MNEPQEQTTERITRIVDLKIPLPWLLGVAAAISWALISMYFSVNNLVKTVGDLQIDVKAGNNSVVAVAGELALLKYRLSDVEGRVNRFDSTKEKAK